MIKILIVEDDPMVAEINKHYLEKLQGFELTAVARSFSEALEVLEYDDIDLVLLDIFMPGKNGLDLLAQIRKMGIGIDIIVISAASDIPTVKKALRFGAVDYLIKPFEFDRFEAALLTYKESLRIMDKKRLSQEELDQHVLYKSPVQGANELPKGISKITLQSMWGKMEELQGGLFTTEEIAQQAGISRVSARKYLQFLVDLGVLDMQLIYGSVGRPIYKYQVHEVKKEVIKDYI
ncbi:response regulator [Ammoniphilus sp. CFH 90114]|uniref:response regulator n=1 Tax=Ammoniphilus sp. CFH 90114 TaxID=2493665 RepID=UPI00100F2902|nr:response regulator [Ammoniphilus sp. CFH 90114]RXT02293.1 response regulator [Ammoniphilus sp. CFH 90114]